MNYPDPDQWPAASDFRPAAPPADEEASVIDACRLFAQQVRTTHGLPPDRPVIISVPNHPGRAALLERCAPQLAALNIGLDRTALSFLMVARDLVTEETARNGDLVFRSSTGSEIARLIWDRGVVEFGGHTRWRPAVARLWAAGVLAAVEAQEERERRNTGSGSVPEALRAPIASPEVNSNGTGRRKLRGR